MTVLAPQDSVIHRRLAENLVRVRELFHDELTSDLPSVNELVQHAGRYHGKMLRPTLVLVTAMAVKPEGEAGGETAGKTAEEHLVAAAVVEMVHLATLVHDDVLDEAQMRRRGPTINHLHGNEAAVMLGDYLISHAYHLCTSLGSSSISRMIAHATNTVCEGELLQLANRHNLDLDEQTYYKIIERKTASLCGACCKVSAELGGCDTKVSEALFDFGQTLGVAFQVIDDVLDLTGDQDTVGKSLGRDLAKGKLTLPLIHALNSAGSDTGSKLRGLLGDQADAGLSDEQRVGGAHQIVGLLEAGDSLAYARGRALELIEQAKTHLREHLADTPARAFMLSMADAVITRKL
jgi:octaprenyl-diphosphate synthase